MEATERLKRQGLRGGGLCKRGMNREAIGKKFVMAGLKTWFKQNWVDIGEQAKRWFIAKCGRSKQKKDAKRKYPKCVPTCESEIDVRGTEKICRCQTKTGSCQCGTKTYKRKNICKKKKS